MTNLMGFESCLFNESVFCLVYRFCTQIEANIMAPDFASPSSLIEQQDS
jgi:hypothetical protein